MPEAAEILIFELSGKADDPRGPALQERIARMLGVIPAARPSGQAETNNADKEPAAETGGAGTQADTATEDRKTPEEMVAWMNEHADEMARMVESEIADTLPPDPTLSVRVELRFQKGSLVMLGTVAVMSWTGSVALETARSELAAVIKIAIQRVIGSVIARLSPDAPGMTCRVTTRARLPGVPEAVGPTAGLPAWPVSISWRDVVLITLAVVVLILLLNAVFDDGVRSPRTADAVPPATAPARP